MKKLVSLALAIIFLVILLLAFSSVVLPLLRPSNGSLNVTAGSNQANVYMDGQLIGKTPLFMDNLRVGDHQIEIQAPNSSFRWKTDTTLSSTALSTFDLDLGPNQLFSSGENLYFKSGPTELSLLTRPEASVVQIDSKDYGKAPLNKTLGNGVHILLVKKAGFLPRQVSINIEPGYKLSAIVYLAANPFEKVSKVDSSSKASLFTITNNFVNLSASYSDWVSGIKHIQKIFSESETHFDSLIDPNGKVYIVNQDSWKKKNTDKSLVNIGYLAKKTDENLAPKAQVEWDKIKAAFN